MRELVGKCSKCQNEVFCESGFLNGSHRNGKLICFDCEEKKKED